MAIKKIGDMDYYEILNLERNASQQEIERAYHLGKTTYSQDSLAYYSLLSERERQYILNKIEEAYENLKDTEGRNLYDLKMLNKSSVSGNRVYFRKSTQKMEIEHAEERMSLWDKIKNMSFRRRKKFRETYL